MDVKVKHEDFARAEAIINEGINKWQENETFPNFTFGPKYVGVSDFSDVGPSLKIIAKCIEDVRFQSERDLRGAIKKLLDANQIEIALPKVFIEEVNKNK